MVEIIIIRGNENLKTKLFKGERVFDAAYKLNLDETDAFGQCGGNCSCATCHVYLEKGNELFPNPGPLEEELLDTAFSYQENSRLACQLVLKEDEGEVVVRLPEVV